MKERIMESENKKELIEKILNHIIFKNVIETNDSSHFFEG